jgi:hypothetical protein
MGNIGEDYPHLITGGAMVDQVQHMPACMQCYVFVLFINKFLSLIFYLSPL